MTMMSRGGRVPSEGMAIDTEDRESSSKLPYLYLISYIIIIHRSAVLLLTKEWRGKVIHW